MVRHRKTRMLILLVWLAVCQVAAGAQNQTQYTLRSITLYGDTFRRDVLRRVIPLKDGERFDPELLRLGLERLRNVYDNYSYLGMEYRAVLIPDDAHKSVSVVIWIYGGRPFSIRAVDVLGMPGSNMDEELARVSLERGKLYNRRLAELFFKENAPSSLRNAVPQSRIHLDTENHGTVAVTFDFRESPTRQGTVYPAAKTPPPKIGREIPENEIVVP